jgi:hypothetical protein
MNRRTKVLFLIVVVAGAAFLGDQLFSGIWWSPWQKAQADIRETDAALAKLKSTLQREEKVSREWDKVKKLLDKPRTPDVENHFLEHLGAICSKMGLEPSMQGVTVGRRGDFKEYLVDTKLKLTWGQYVDLLGELNDSRELLKPIRITLNSQYEKEDRLDVDLRLSTIEFDPVPVKAGMK